MIGLLDHVPGHDGDDCEINDLFNNEKVVETAITGFDFTVLFESGTKLVFNVGRMGDLYYEIIKP